MIENDTVRVFSKLPILKLSLCNSAALCFWKKLRRDLLKNVTF